MAEQAARRGARIAVADVCTAAVAALPIDGAGVSAMYKAAAGHPLYSTGPLSERVEELQITLGEGPCVDAFTLGSAVLAPDLRAAGERLRWPVFAVEAVTAGAVAVFAFPLRIGAISPGVLDLYSDVPVELDPAELADAKVFADTATLVLLGARIDRADGSLENLGGYRAEIDQATGMLAVQLGVRIEEAFVRLRAYAYAHERRLAEVAADLVARRLRFGPDEHEDVDEDKDEDRSAPDDA
ncbi:GAF and ANTAR domain-containing protein [Streptomyces sp. NBC_01244]|uniref:GAF and ANTAR domain-containing protein n=1 Tax=Streptomyces sp. NBC_01244 TaxID=2903797 RepID=UPI002E10FAA4|nr:GAF and ANTAR domain-containing protein [Streptomyces sp. NBC_01244]